MTGLPTIETARLKKQTAAKQDPFLAGPPIEEQESSVAESKKIELEIKTFPVSLVAVIGSNFGHLRRNVQLRLTRRQAHAMRVLVEGLEHSASTKNGRRLNEQDMIRIILESVADQLNLQD
jgi:hypothetical protein